MIVHRNLSKREPGAEKLQLELIRTESEDRLDKKISLWDTVTMYELDEGMERSKYFYELKALDAVTSVYVTNAVKNQRLEETQLELYQLDE